MTAPATGPFDVKLAPQPFEGEEAGSTLARMTIDKRYHGDLEATGTGQMLTAGTAVKGSAAYVAVEIVRGTLHGRQGTFELHHTGIMDRGTPRLTIAVVPDSGTGELAGLAGTMGIRIEAGGAHFYDFEYSLPAPRL
jgi:Protein of unknown function (DUF3224)